MKCPKCQAENSETKKFCTECGTKLLKVCPQCGSEILAADKFCGECGYHLVVPFQLPPKELSFDQKLAKIQKYLPGGLTEKILAQRGKIEGERRQVTVLFCDMEGFTPLVEKLGPEEAYAIMDQVYEILIRKVHDYEGTVNEMTGDGIMALFGAPIALEDAPQRAIRSALAIHREITRFSDHMKQEKGIPPIKMRMGIHTGPVIVGALGNDLRVEFKAVGDTVNLTSRVQSLAEAGTTFVTAETFKLAEGLFRFESLGERKVKGKEEPVKVYQVIAASSRRTKFDVSAERGLTPFVGRGRELELLLDGFERSKVGKGQAFSIIAEAGVGKSRLLYEFRKAVANENVTFLEGKCLSYSRDVAYHPVIDLLKSNFNILEDEQDFEVKDMVRKGLRSLNLEEDSSLPYFLDLLSVHDSGIDRVRLNPDSIRKRTLDSLKRLVLRGSEVRPLILAVEDLHWIDKSSEEALKYLLGSISGARVLLIFTFRPEFVQSWGGKSFHNQITLNRLSNRESMAMIAHLLKSEHVDPELINLILEKTEGIPFFIEEFIRSIVDLKMIAKKGERVHLTGKLQDLEIPSTIQDLIMARVDSLPEEAKKLLQAGAAIEREFGYSLIKHVSHLPEEELLSNLSRLKDMELLYERGIFPQCTFVFKHALTREVVYDSLLTARKRSVHEEIGKGIEAIYQGHLSDHYETLAYHYFAGNNNEKAARYSTLVAQKAAKNGSLNEAILYSQRAISSLEKLPQESDVQIRIIDARVILGIRFNEMNYFREAGEAIEPIIDLALRLNYEKRISQLFTVMGTLDFCVREDFPGAFKHLGKALEISEKRRDASSESAARYWLGYASALDCNFERALHHLNWVLDYNLQFDTGWAAVIKDLTSYLAYFWPGKMNTAAQLSSEGMRMAEENGGDLLPKIFGYSCYGIACYGKGSLEAATNNLVKGCEFNERLNQFWWLVGGNYFLGEVYSALGNYRLAIPHYEKAVAALDNKKVMPSWLILNRIGLARAKILGERAGFELGALRSAISQNRVRIHEGQLCRYMAEILMNTEGSGVPETEDWIQKAIDANERNRMRWHLAMDYAFYAELLKRKGDRSKAKENLGKAIEILKQCGADGWVEKYEKELASINSL